MVDGGLPAVCGASLWPTDTTATATPTVTTTRQTTEPQTTGTIRGIVADKTNTAVVGATITLTRPDSSGVQQTTTDDNGQYAFGGVGAWCVQRRHLGAWICLAGCDRRIACGGSVHRAGRNAGDFDGDTEVDVTMSHVEIAEAQIKEEEKQRVLGFVPNYYVSYVPDAASLNTKQKFELAWKPR